MQSLILGGYIYVAPTDSRKLLLYTENTFNTYRTLILIHIAVWQLFNEDVLDVCIRCKFNSDPFLKKAGVQGLISWTALQKCDVCLNMDFQ